MVEAHFDLAGKRVFVAGHRGMAGSAIARRLSREECDVLTVPRETLDLIDQSAVRQWFARERPDAVVVAAAKVGGILANDSYPADFLYDNLMIEANVIEAAHRSDTHRLLFLGSSCIYPKFAEQPMREEALLTGALEPTNEWYAIAKIAGIKLAQAYRRQHGRDFISAMPTNLYGPGDNFSLSSSHVVPALIRKAHEAARTGACSMEVWGTGSARREFLHVDDLADACVHLLQHYSDEGHVNVGCGEEISILDLVSLVNRIVGFEGAIAHDLTKPDGTPRKLLDTARLTKLGWTPSIPLEQGIAETYAWFRAEVEAGRMREVA